MGIDEIKRNDARFRSFYLFLILSLCLFSALNPKTAAAQSDIPLADELQQSDLADIRKAALNPDSASLRSLARRMGVSELMTAVYKGSRAVRLIALDASQYVENPMEVLPYLVALMGASSRETASRAAGSFYEIIINPKSFIEQNAEMISGQAEQLISKLIPIAKDSRLDTDIRITAATGVDRLSVYVKKYNETWNVSLLNDSNASIRRAALSFFKVPMENDMLISLAKIAVGDSNVYVRTGAAAVLCENALSRSVKEPSDDLAKILITEVKDSAASVEMIAPIIMCVTGFVEGEKRRSIVESALSNTNSEIPAFVESLKIK